MGVWSSIKLRPQQKVGRPVWNPISPRTYGDRPEQRGSRGSEERGGSSPVTIPWETRGPSRENAAFQPSTGKRRCSSGPSHALPYLSWKGCSSPKSRRCFFCFLVKVLSSWLRLRLPRLPIVKTQVCPPSKDKFPNRKLSCQSTRRGSATALYGRSRLR